MSFRRFTVAALSFGVVTLATNPLTAQSNGSANAWNPDEILRTEKFVKPPANLERMIMTPRVDISYTNPSPDRTWFIRTTGPTRGSISAYGKTHLWLGGLQVDTRGNRARSVTISNDTGLTLVNPRTNATRVISVPSGATVTSPIWSPNGTQIAYVASFDAATHVYLADVATGKSVQLTKTPLLATLVTGIDFTGDGKSIVATLIPDGRGAVPTHGAGGIEDGPQVRLTDGKALPQPYHYSLLQDPHEQEQLKYYTTSQLALIDVKSKAVRKIGAPQMIRSVDASPDGLYFRVTTMLEPFSYVVPVNSFGTKQELWDNTGKVIATLAESPLREGGRGGFGGRGGAAPSDTGKRNLEWNPVGTGLVYLQSVMGAANTGGGAAAGRGGRAGRSAVTGVKYVNWLPPFGPNDTKVLYEGGPQLSAVAYSADAKVMFVSDSGSVIAISNGQRHNLGRTVTLGGGGGGGFGGRGGGNPNDTVSMGQLLTTRGPIGQSFVVVGSDGKTVALTGTNMPRANWHSQAPQPWLDKLNIETGARTRVFESPKDGYDTFVAALDNDVTQFIYTHESPTVIQDAWLRDNRANTSKKLTSNVDVGPEVTGAQLKRFQVTRPRDGNKIWVEVTLPADWKPGTKLPGVIWFYPREYTSQDDYDRSRYSTNINRFPEVPSLRPASSTRLWVSQGYAFIEPDIPIFGDSGKMNDNYTRDLKENLDAVLDAVVDMGFVDRDKMGIGGHSYGAFSTVNAMTLVPYFKGGIAGDGMYNRSLTPFGFQSERRSFFEAQDTYLDMSPFYRADKIAGALLMYHSLEDQNSGTAPESSVRMYKALQGLGKPAALYMYPYEDHSVGTYASDLDMWARWVAWMDTYVKGVKSPGTRIVPE
jgi:dipeptidyl aminopeptidase/acylaminoacyl peptidase